jgi:glycosyltransferase involved in cell wall biosynthesis
MRNEQYVVVNLLSHFEGWIIENMLLEAAKSSGVNVKFNFFPSRKRDFFSYKRVKSLTMPQIGSVNIFAHHETYFYCLRHKLIPAGINRLFVTHFMDNPKWSSEKTEQVNKLDRIFVQNLKIKETLISLGVKRKIIDVVYGAVDKNKFYPSFDELQETPYVLISGDFKPRKNPKLILETIESMPNILFILHGKNLDFFTEPNIDLKNLRLIPFKYENQPYLVRNAHCLLSLSTVEGGPINVLEALSSGTPVVSTPVGFCQEIISNNIGVILDKEPSLNEIQIAVQRSFEMKKFLKNQDLLDGKLDLATFGKRVYF